MQFPTHLRDTLEGIVDVMHEGLQLLDFEYRYLYLNKAAAVRHGRSSREELMGRTLLECYPGVEDTMMFKRLTRCMKERTSDRFENEFEYPDGHTSWFDIHIEPVPEGVMVLSLDINTAKALEKSLSRVGTFEALGYLTGGVVHDFNNLLSVIMTSCDVLREKFPYAAGAQPELSMIETAGDRGSQLLNQLLNVSQEVSNNGSLHIDRTLSTLEPMLRQITGDVASLVLDLDAREHTTQLEAGQLDRVLINLITNARDAIAPAHGTIRLETRHIPPNRTSPGSHGYVRIRVIDDGCGIPPEHQERIFDPLYTTKDTCIGHGLGLSTSLAIIQHAGGSITVESERGQGSTFEVHLPTQPYNG